MFIDFELSSPCYAEVRAYERHLSETLNFGLKQAVGLKTVTIESGGDLRAMGGVLECRKRHDEDEGISVGQLVHLGVWPDRETGKEIERYSVGLDIEKGQYERLFQRASSCDLPRYVRIEFPWRITDNETFGIRYRDVGDHDDMKWYNVNQPTVEISGYSFTLFFVPPAGS